MKRLLVVSIACLGLLIGVTGMAQANLITNGSFEDGNYSSSAPFMTLSASDASPIEGWTVAIGSVDWINGYWQASGLVGTKSLDLAGYQQHGLIISDPFNIEEGKTYRVQFDMAGNPDQRYDKTLVSVSFGDASGISHYFTFDQNGNTKAQMGWETKFFDFVAFESGATVISFGDTTVGGDSWGAAIDNVSVDLAPIPEPSTFLLLGGGIAGLAIYMRRVRRQHEG